MINPECPVRRKGLRQSLGSGECPGQHLGIGGAHVGNPQAIEHTMPRLLLGGLQRLQKTTGRRCSPTLQCRQTSLLQSIEIVNGVNQVPLHQLLNPLRSKAVNVQGIPAGPVAQSTAENRWTTAVDTAGGGLQFLGFLGFSHQEPHQGRTAFRTVAGKRKGFTWR